MKNIRQALVLLLCTALIAQAQGNTFNKVRYNGGTVASKVNPKSWNNKLTVTATTISLRLKDGAKVDIPSKNVTSISYGQEAHRRVGTMVALAILVSPVALFGLFSKTRLHYIGIQYKTPEVTNAGVLLQGDKDNYRAILVALQSVAGVPVSVSDKDREFVPVGTTVVVAREDQEFQPAERPQVAAKIEVASTKTESVAATSVQLTPPAATETGIVATEASVIGASGYSTDKGFLITSIETGSAAAGINLKTGDAIVKVDGREVHSRRDVDAVIAMSASGIVKLDCLIGTSSTGMASVERTVRVR